MKTRGNQLFIQVLLIVIITAIVVLLALIWLNWWICFPMQPGVYLLVLI